MIVIVPVSHHIEPQVDESLRELERRGVTVWRQYGFSAIDQGRCLLAQKAVYEAKTDEIMWIDADVSFNPDDVFKLRRHLLPFVCGVYSVKGWPQLTTVFADDAPVVLGDGGGLRQIKYAATGFIYTRASVYRDIVHRLSLPLTKIWGDQNAYPWFLPILESVNGTLQYRGEDYAFSFRARQAGYRLYADTSIKLGHIGPYSYSFEFLAAGVQPQSHGVTVHPKPGRGSIAAPRHY